MSVETDFVAYLKGVTGVANLVGERIYPWGANQNPGSIDDSSGFPYITYFRVTTEKVSSLDKGASGLDFAQFQFDAWSRRRLECWAVADELEKALCGFKGTMGSTEVGGFVFRDRMDLYEEEDEVHRTMLKFNVAFCTDVIDNIQP